MTHDRSVDPKTRPADKPANPAQGIDKDADTHVDQSLDEGLKQTFPAGAPVSINPGADRGHGRNGRGCSAETA